MSSLRIAMTKHPVFLYTSVASMFAAAALRPSPSPFPLILLLATLQLYARDSLHTEGVTVRFRFLWLALSFTVAVAHLLTAWRTFTIQGVSLLFLISLSALSSAIALTAIILDAKLCHRINSPWSEITFFPLVWATIWAVASHITPLGSLITWSPTMGLEGYRWMIPFTGPVIVDWVIAAWASLCSQAVIIWFIREGIDHDEQPLLGRMKDRPFHKHAKERGTPSPTSLDLLMLGGLLSALVVPSYIIGDTPTAVRPPAHVTALTVGCVLPPPGREGFEPVVDDYIEHSKRMTDADLLLWPEGAAFFGSPADRDAVLKEVRNSIRGPYVGVSFEEFNPLDAGRAIRRKGLALVSNRSDTVQLLYYKRNLVPFAESDFISPSFDPPSIYALALGPPKGITKGDWTPALNYTRSVPLTASISLDFAQPSPFRDLSARPALILAPARTWEISMGRTMWEHARARAAEIGTSVLWCDQVLSGVAGPGMSEPVQIGSGSWTRAIGVKWPYEERRTMYAWVGGDWLTLLALVGIVGIGQVTGSGLIANIAQARHIVHLWKKWTKVAELAAETAPLLH